MNSKLDYDYDMCSMSAFQPKSVSESCVCMLEWLPEESKTFLKTGVIHSYLQVFEDYGWLLYPVLEAKTALLRCPN